MWKICFIFAISKYNDMATLQARTYNNAQELLNELQYGRLERVLSRNLNIVLTDVLGFEIEVMEGAEVKSSYKFDNADDMLEEWNEIAVFYRNADNW